MQEMTQAPPRGWVGLEWMPLGVAAVLIMRQGMMAGNWWTVHCGGQKIHELKV